MKKEDSGTWQLLHTLQEQSLLTPDEAQSLRQELEFLFEESFLSWEAIRPMFGFRVEPMNSANLCPTFSVVLNEIDRFRRILNADISIEKRKAMYATTLLQARTSIAAQLGIATTSLALVRNTTEANNVVSNGFMHWDNGEVLLWNENHPTNKGAWELRRTGSRSIRYFEFKEPSKVTRQEIIDTICAGINLNTRLISFTEVSNVTGITIPTREVIQAIRAKEQELGLSRSIHVHVDGAQSWGSRNLDLKALDCDSFAASSHKWFMGPFETGILFVKEGKAVDFTINNYGYTGDIEIPDWDDLPDDASRFELLGQRDDANLYALLLTSDIHKRINANEQGQPDPSRIEQRVAFLANTLIARLKRSTLIRAEFATPEASNVRHGVVVFQVRNRAGNIVPAQRIRDFLYGDVPVKFASAHNSLGLRLCPHVMTSLAAIEEVVRLIETFSTPVSDPVTKEILADSVMAVL